MRDHEKLEKDGRIVILRSVMCQALPYLCNSLEVVKYGIIKWAHVQLRSSVESQKHRMAWAGRDIIEHRVPAPCHGQSHLPLEHLPQSPIQPGLGHFPMEETSTASLGNPYSQEFPANIQSKIQRLWFLPLPSATQEAGSCLDFAVWHKTYLSYYSSDNKVELDLRDKLQTVSDSDECHCPQRIYAAAGVHCFPSHLGSEPGNVGYHLLGHLHSEKI